MMINFNNAGASTLDKEILSKMFSYFNLERNVGGYEAYEKKKKVINKFYENLAKLLNCLPSEISFFSSATLAWNQIFSSIVFDKNDNIIIFDNEYSSNYISMLKKRPSFNQIKIVNINKEGIVNFEQLDNIIDSKTKLLHVNHIASQCGNETPIMKIGELLKKKNPAAIYFVDACQSVGQTEIDVNKTNCDILTASGRKYLMGPRGTGFSYIKKSVRNILVPSIEDMTSTDIKKDFLILKKKSNFLETFEHSPALKLALSMSIKKILKIGVKKINRKIINLSRYLRSELRKNNKIIFFENDDYLSGINTIDFLGVENEKVYNFLKKKKINTFLSNKNMSYLYFRKLRKKNVLRISFNYYNTRKEVDMFVDIINKYVK